MKQGERFVSSFHIFYLDAQVMSGLLVFVLHSESRTVLLDCLVPMKPIIFDSDFWPTLESSLANEPGPLCSMQDIWGWLGSGN